MMRGMLAACLIAATLSGGCASRPGENDLPSDMLSARLAKGQALAERECASCHAIDKTSSSVNTSAPPLRDVLGANAVAFLPYRLNDAMSVAHRQMPQFDFDPATAEALVAYIQSLSER